MSRISLHRPRPPRAVRDRPAAGTRLLTTPHSRLDHSLRRGIPLALSRVEACPEPRRRGSQERNGWGLLPSPPQHTTHYKRCPKAQRLCLRSDQSSSRPLHGRSPDKSRHALLQGSCLRISAPVEGHTYVADLVLAGESQQSDERRLKTNAPFKDSTVVTTGEHPTTNGGHGSPLPSLRMVEHFWWTGPPHTENFSALLHILSEVRGKDSTVVTTGLLPTTNAGLGSPLPSLRMVEHFWWTGLPHSENSSRLVHIPSEVRGYRTAVADVKPPLRRTPRIGAMAGRFWWSRPPHTEIISRLLHVLSEARGCRKAGADVEHPLWRTTPIGTGVAVFLRNRPGPSIPFPSLSIYPLPDRDDRLVALGWGSPLVPPPTHERSPPTPTTE